jgi:hypothetical protein
VNSSNFHVEDISLNDLVMFTPSEAHTRLRRNSEIGVYFTELPVCGWLNMLLVAPLEHVLVDPLGINWFERESSEYSIWLNEKALGRSHRPKFVKELVRSGVEHESLPHGLIGYDEAYKKRTRTHQINQTPILNGMWYLPCVVPLVNGARKMLTDWLSIAAKERGPFFCRRLPIDRALFRYWPFGINWTETDHDLGFMFCNQLLVAVGVANDLEASWHRAKALLCREIEAAELNKSKRFEEYDQIILAEDVLVSSSSHSEIYNGIMAEQVASYRVRLMNLLEWPVFRRAVDFSNDASYLKRFGNSQAGRFGIENPYDIAKELRELRAKLQTKYPSYDNHPFDELARRWYLSNVKRS